MQTDLSIESINYLKQYTPPQYRHVEFAQKSADDATSFGDSNYDTFILNSVVQYFPSLSYLEEVITNIAGKVASGGTIFIGDVRNLKYLEVFHTSVEIYKASETDCQELLREKIQNRIANDVELSVDPVFFMSLKEKCPRIRYVEMKIKSGVIQNELTKFRYDVLLHIDKEHPQRLHEVQWDSDRETLRQEVSELKVPFVIKNVPNYSVNGAFKAMGLLQANKEVSVIELKSLIDFDVASQNWKDVYDLFPQGSRVELTLEVGDPNLCAMMVQ